MDRHRIRNVVPPVYALLVVAGFLINTRVGVVVLIVGAALSGVLWSALSGPRGGSGDGSPVTQRSIARAARRAGRR